MDTIRLEARPRRSAVASASSAIPITPFTTDYENILLSIRLISDPREWGRFSDWGTTIIEGIDQATQLFKTFSFVNASGNLMVIFTDGADVYIEGEKVHTIGKELTVRADQVIE